MSTAIKPRMKPEDLKLLELLKFSPDAGLITFEKRRILIFDAEAMGILRRELVYSLGEEDAWRILGRFGFVSGYQDMVSSTETFTWECEEACWTAGLILHNLQGKVRTTPLQLEFDKARKHFYAELRWDNSYEAAQHLKHIGPSRAPVCWTLVGYASGHATACLGEPVYFVEKECMARGDSRCFAVGRPAQAWGKEMESYSLYFAGSQLKKQMEELRGELTSKTAQLERQKREVIELKQSLAQLQRPLIFHSRNMEDLLRLVSRAAHSNVEVLIQGESGTGKELIARMIHEHSGRQGPFVAVNCGALTETLLESELFGHVKGSFTGAVADKRGLFEEANHGTLLLDEIGEISPALQVKLLRVIQEKEVRRVGGNRSTKVDVRILAASNRDLAALVEERRFRSDLLFRLNIVTISIPALRERPEDIVLLVRHFLEKHAQASNRPIPAISREVLDLFLHHSWPGNVRELENVIERALVLTDSSRIEIEHLPIEMQRPKTNGSAANPTTLRDLEDQHILKALEQFGGNQEKAAKFLGIGNTTLWRRLRRIRAEAGASAVR